MLIFYDYYLLATLCFNYYEKFKFCLANVLEFSSYIYVYVYIYIFIYIKVRDIFCHLAICFLIAYACLPLVPSYYFLILWTFFARISLDFILFLSLHVAFVSYFLSVFSGNNIRMSPKKNVIHINIAMNSTTH